MRTFTFQHVGRESPTFINTYTTHDLWAQILVMEDDIPVAHFYGPDAKLNSFKFVNGISNDDDHFTSRD